MRCCPWANSATPNRPSSPGWCGALNAAGLQADARALAVEIALAYGI